MIGELAGRGDSPVAPPYRGPASLPLGALALWGLHGPLPRKRDMGTVPMSP